MELSLVTTYRGAIVIDGSSPSAVKTIIENTPCVQLRRACQDECGFDWLGLVNSIQEIVVRNVLVYDDKDVKALDWLLRQKAVIDLTGLAISTRIGREVGQLFQDLAEEQHQVMKGSVFYHPILGGAFGHGQSVKIWDSAESIGFTTDNITPDWCKVGSLYRVYTSQGSLAVWDSAQGDYQTPTIVMLHANTASSRFFHKQMEDSELSSRYRIIAIDLPGHGRSASAMDPKATYSFPGYAAAVAQVINRIVLQRHIILGWSLGGHVALELEGLTKKCHGIVISGAPPIALSPEGFGQGFAQNQPELMGLIGKETLSPDETKVFMAGAGYSGKADQEWILQEASRTDGVARALMLQACLAGVGQDEKALVAACNLPIAIIGGKNDPGINYEYVSKLAFGNLWENRLHLIADAGHAAMLEQPAEFNVILTRFARHAFGWG